jgi:hypothetical protein
MRRPCIPWTRPLTPGKPRNGGALGEKRSEAMAGHALLEEIAASTAPPPPAPGRQLLAAPLKSPPFMKAILVVSR